MTIFFSPKCFKWNLLIGSVHISEKSSYFKKKDHIQILGVWVSNLMAYFCLSHDFQGRKEPLSSLIRKFELKKSLPFSCYSDLSREFSPDFCMNKETSYHSQGYYLDFYFTITFRSCSAFNYCFCFFLFFKSRLARRVVPSSSLGYILFLFLEMQNNRDSVHIFFEFSLCMFLTLQWTWITTSSLSFFTISNYQFELHMLSLLAMATCLRKLLLKNNLKHWVWRVSS